MVPEVVFGIDLGTEPRNVQRCRCKAFLTHLPALFWIFLHYRGKGIRNG
jgi:hypothetical protein